MNYFRKTLAIALTIIYVVTCIAGCDIDETNPFDHSSIEESSVLVNETSINSNIIPIIIEESTEIDESPSEETSSESDETGTEETKYEESSSEESVEDPVYSGGDVIAPVTPSDEGINIWEVTNTDSSSLVVVGLDTSDPTVAEGISSLTNLMHEYSNRTGFFAYSLDGSVAVAYNCESEFFSACTVKTGFILYCCLAIDQGLADKDTVMTYQEKYYHGGSGYIKYCEVGSKYTLERLIYLSLNLSDNIAYEMLTAYFGHEGYNHLMEQLGVPSLTLGSSLWSYKMNAHDLAILWRELYFYFQTDSYMAKVYQEATYNTKYNYGTRYIKSQYNYNHKSGDSQASHPVINDGSIVWAEIPYVVTILNSSMGTSDDEYHVAQAVKIINDYFMPHTAE